MTASSHDDPTDGILACEACGQLLQFGLWVECEDCDDTFCRDCHYRHECEWSGLHEAIETETGASE